MTILERLLAAWREVTDTNARSTRLGELLGELLDGDRELSLESLRDEVVEAFETARGGDVTDESLTTMEALADVADAVTGRIVAQAEASQRLAGLDERIGAAREVSAPAPVDDAGENEGDSEGDATPPGEAQDAPDAPASVPAPEDQGSDDGGASQDVTPAPTTAGTRRVPLRQMSSSQPPARRDGQVRYRTMAAADIPGVPAGAELGNLESLSRAFASRLAGLARLGAGQASQVGIATVERITPEHLTVYGNQDDYGKVEAACAETGLPGGNLVAAGGWCAPSETTYDLVGITADETGMVDLPEVTAARGGLRWPRVPDFSTVYTSTGFFHQTEADAIAGTPKPSYEIGCTTFDEARLDVEGAQFEVPILTERGYPEVIDYYMGEAMTAYQHRINAWVLNRMNSFATTVTIPAPVTAGDPPVTTDNHGPGAVATMLSALELQVEYLRYRYRRSELTIEMVAPHWVRGILRADLSKHAGVDRLTVTDQQLDAHLQARGVRPQWVMDWQDALAGNNPALFGGATAPVKWPTAVRVLLYTAGTLFRMNADVITLSGIYDSTNIKRNVYTRLFMEQGIQVAKRTGTVLGVDFTLVPNGLTAGSVVVQGG